MPEKDQIASIADASKPNPGRIYDFILGGNHNFEVDRQAAQQLLKFAPDFPKSARTIRWFLGEAVRRLLADGFTQFIDFASGLPTVDHIHQVAPKGTKVVYSDIDPVTVAYGQEIIKDEPDVRYIACDIATPEHLLEDPTISRFLDKNRKTAIGMNGIAWFVKNEDLSHSLRVVYDWAGNGSRLFLSDFDSDPSKATASMKESSDLYEKLNQPFFRRIRETLLELCRPWKVMKPGFQPLEQWIGIQAGISEIEMSRFEGNLIGAILEK
ncbi:MAG: SAM-dependent methyltransferase [Spirochaetia bacterium]|jgi:O-methyltransferase involved in polyketide biosynthesis